MRERKDLQPNINPMLDWRVRYHEPPGNIPTILTPLIGREQDVAAVCTLLERPEVRLLTLFGTGGVGKTRLAFQVALQVQERFSDGVCVVLLAALREPDLVFPAVAKALALQERGEHSLVAQIMGALQRKHMLLVLDNVEQVMSIAPQIEDVLAACPLLKIVVTSREVLRVHSEQVYPLSPLALPNLTSLPHAEELLHFTAIALFVQRVRTLLPTFQLTTTNAQAIAEICVRLDGLPLALELAAAHIRLFPPMALLSRLTQHLQLLNHSMRTLPVRHQTLRSTLDWSYTLLNEEEQRLFRHLSIFVGRWTLEAVEAVWQRDHKTTPETLSALEGVASLLNKSLLLQTAHEGEELRLLMLETVREYGLTLLRESGEFAHVQQAHALYYLAWVEQAQSPLKGPQQRLWKERLEQEQGNLQAAFHWCLEQEQADLACRFGAAMGWYWYISGHWSEGRHWLEAALHLAHEGVPLVVRARACCSAGLIASCHGDYLAARAWIEESIVLFRAVQDMYDLTFALSILGALIADNDVVASRTLAQESVTLAREVGEPWNLAFALYLQGLAIASPTRYAEASVLLEQSLALFRQVDDTRQLTFVLAQLGSMMASQGKLNRAETLCRESLTFARTLGYKPTLLRTIYELAKVLRRRGDTLQATLLFQEGAVLAADLGDRCVQAMIRQEMAYLARVQQDIEQATTLLQESLLLYREMDETFLLVGALCDLGNLLLAQGERERAMELYQESLLLSHQIGHTEAFGWSLAGLAQIACTRGQFHRAVCLFAAAEARTLTDEERDHVERGEYTRGVNEGRTHLGDKAFAETWAEGRMLTAEQALAVLEDMAALRPEPVQRPASPLPAAPDRPIPFGLTPREMDVLRLVSRGLTNVQIAEQLIVSPLTVNAHVRSIYSKLDVTSRSAATRLALEHHLV